jgi:hypothetical protein
MSAHTTTHAQPTKYTPRHSSTPDVKVDTETGRVSRKVRIHVVCIVLAGVVTMVLVQFHVASPILLGAGPAAPSIAQEIFDRIFRL